MPSLHAVPKRFLLHGILDQTSSNRLSNPRGSLRIRNPGVAEPTWGQVVSIKKIRCLSQFIPLHLPRSVPLSTSSSAPKLPPKQRRLHAPSLRHEHRLNATSVESPPAMAKCDKKKVGSARLCARGRLYDQLHNQRTIDSLKKVCVRIEYSMCRLLLSYSNV